MCWRSDTAFIQCYCRSDYISFQVKYYTYWQANHFFPCNKSENKCLVPFVATCKLSEIVCNLRNVSTDKRRISALKKMSCTGGENFIGMEHNCCGLCSPVEQFLTYFNKLVDIVFVSVICPKVSLIQLCFGFMQHHFTACFILCHTVLSIPLLVVRQSMSSYVTIIYTMECLTVNCINHQVLSSSLLLSREIPIGGLSAPWGPVLKTHTCSSRYIHQGAPALFTTYCMQYILSLSLFNIDWFSSCFDIVQNWLIPWGTEMNMAGCSVVVSPEKRCFVMWLCC